MDSNNRLQKWLNKTTQKQQQNFQDNQNRNNNLDLNNRIHISNPLQFNSDGELRLFENNSLIVYVQKSMHQRHKKFHLEDSLYKIKIKEKTNVQNSLLLKDLLEVFDVALKFVLKNLKTFFKSENHHIAYLTLTQDPLVNGLNTG